MGRDWPRAGVTKVAAEGIVFRRRGHESRFIGWNEIAGVEAENIGGSRWHIRLTLETGEPLRLPGLTTPFSRRTAEFDAQLARITAYWHEFHPRYVSPANLSRLRRDYWVDSPAVPDALIMRPIAEEVGKRIFRLLGTGIVAAAAAGCVFGLYNSVMRSVSDHPAIAAYQAARPCIAENIDNDPSPRWCVLTDPTLSVGPDYANLSSYGTIPILATSAVESRDYIPDMNDELQVFADFGRTQSIPPGLTLGTSVSEVVLLSDQQLSEAATVRIGTANYPTIYNPQVQYTMDTTSILSAAAGAVFFLFWTVKRIKRRYSPSAIGLYYGLLGLMVTTVFFSIVRQDWRPLSTSITAEWVSCVFVFCAAFAVGVVWALTLRLRWLYRREKSLPLPTRSRLSR